MSRYKSVLLFGGPGVGKGTQGQVLGQVPGFEHCASGDIFRSIDEQSEVGRIFLQYSTKGELVPDEVTVRMWQENVAARIERGRYDPHRDLLLLDGIPRTVEQTQIMDDLIDVLKVVHLTCDDPEAMVQRLRRRALKQNRPDDADENVIRNRWEVYERETAPVIGHYRADRIAHINAIGTPAQVLRKILETVEPVQSEHFPVFEG